MELSSPGPWMAELAQQTMSTPAKEIVPWLLSMISLLCAYYLNNHRVMLGRYLGLISAFSWGAYGIWVGQWFFLVNHTVFAFIYINAIVKFNRKRDEYKALSEEQHLEIEKLRSKLELAHHRRSRHLSRKERRIQEVAKALVRQSEINLQAARDICEALHKGPELLDGNHDNASAVVKRE